MLHGNIKSKIAKEYICIYITEKKNYDTQKSLKKEKKLKNICSKINLEHKMNINVLKYVYQIHDSFTT